MATRIFTIGHSNHPLERFIELLRSAAVTAVADVRSVPYSRHASQFNREPLHEALRRAGVAYVFLGEELGARPADPASHRDGVADWDVMARSASFRAGLDRVRRGAERYVVSLLCAEKEPLDCHRTLLVARQLVVQRGCEVEHILADGSLEGHGETERRLLALTGQSQLDMFGATDEGEALARAYELRRLEVGWRPGGGDESGEER